MSSVPLPPPANRRDTRRRFEQWVKHPGCGANLVSAVHNVKMGAVARRENPTAPKEGQSAFALARGRRFEAGLVSNNGERLLRAMSAQQMFSRPDPHFLDFRISINGGPLADIDDAIDHTERFLQVLARDHSFEGVVSSATLRIPKGVMLPEATLIIDALSVAMVDGRPMISVGEIKTYADRGGHTSKSDLAHARAQMGLYVHALALVLDQLELVDDIELSLEGFLVLTHPGSNNPSVRVGEDLRYQAERARKGFELMETAARNLSDLVGDDGGEGSTSLFDMVLAAPTAFADACLSFCERAPSCYEKALKMGNGAALGDDVDRFLNGLSLHRADELMGGARPRNEIERDFLRRMKNPLDGAS
jgi:hypothetical protein